MKSTILIFIISTISFISGCQATGEQYQADVFTTNDVNTKKEVKTIELLMVQLGKVQIDNTSGKETATKAAGIFGAVLGAALGSSKNSETAALAGLAGGTVGAVGGSMVADKVMVDGVMLTYIENGKTYTSAQVGKECQFKVGIAAMIFNEDTKETRIQPNNTCPITQ
jgi:outer membrane lipoprotein SlyB